MRQHKERRRTGWIGRDAWARRRWTLITWICLCIAPTSAGVLASAETVPLRDASAATSSSRPSASQPSSCPAWNGGGTDRIDLPIPGRDSPAVCWINRPPEYGPGQRLPLLVCLHGTDDTAEQMVHFWKQRRTRFPVIIAAPQGVGQGWCSDDVATIQATFDFLRRCVWHDANRVLLAGFSAGGVMTMQSLYHDQAPATAAAALANYVPPLLTAEEVTARRHIPVFYAVGMADINRERMRTGLEFLRAAGGNVKLYHPRIGHTLDPGVAQAAVDWFFEQCEKQTAAAIASAENGPFNAVSAERLEQIVSQPRWHPQPLVKQAGEVLNRLESPGRELLLAAKRLLNDDKVGEAFEILRKIETDYTISRLGLEAREHRERIERDPVLGAKAATFAADARSQRAMAEYARAQRLVAQRQLDDAAEVCRQIMTTYADTPAATRANRLLGLLEGRTRQ